MEKAIFAAGCFWGVEETFRRIPGVVNTRVGYSGGAWENPTYEDVCTGKSNHAEVVEVTFDPGQISFPALLEVFWACHDPTTKNRQGLDIGSQYRSAIFFLNEDQREQAEVSLARADKDGRFSRPIVTEITKAGTFWEAEEYHQQYLAKRGRGSCH